MASTITNDISQTMKMHKNVNRRQFIKSNLTAALAVSTFPVIIPASALGKDGATPPSERIILGGIGIGGRGRYMLENFLHQPDVECVAVCDVQAERRERIKKMVDAKYGNQACVTYRDFRELLARPDIDAVLIATGSNWHALLSIHGAKAGKDVYCEKPCTKNIAESLALAEAFRRSGGVFQAGMQRRSVPNFVHAVELARRGRLGRLQTLHAHPCGLGTGMSKWAPAEPEPPQDQVDWDMFLGPAAWRPYNRSHMSGFYFERGGGLTGCGCLEWVHCVDLCQWANDADGTAAVEYEPVDGQLHARYANGMKLVMRTDGWLPLGSCPVRFEGDAGWVETGDSGAAANPTTLLAEMQKKTGGAGAGSHVRNFLDCVKSRGQPRTNAEVACWSHITCQAANIALFLKRKVTFDPKKCEFVNDEQANRLRSEALREPWRI